MPFYASSEVLEAEISRKAAEICDQIATDLGAEIHDDLIQKLFLFRLFIDQIEQASNDPIEIESIAIKMRTEFEHIVRTVRRISRRLLPIRNDGDTLQQAAEALCQNLEIPGRGYVHFVNKGEAVGIERGKEMYILRIIEELVENAFRHSSAWHVWVRMNWSKDELLIEVEDDGSGFSRVEKFINKLREKHNTLRVRSIALGTAIKYSHGAKGLLAQLRLKIEELQHAIPKGVGQKASSV